MEFGKRLNQRAIEAVAKAHGYTVDFLDDPPDTVTDDGALPHEKDKL